jgi:hypothetical protein
MNKIIKKFQKDVQTHRADNKKIMKAREKQGEFNVKLMYSLEIIENKLDKESGARKSGSPRRTRSISWHHQHSPRHSNKRAHSSSCPSPLRKHKSSGEDEI